MSVSATGDMSSLPAVAVAALKDDNTTLRGVGYAMLVQAQQTKAANLIAYLNSDTRTWQEEHHQAVRAYLGLPDSSPEGQQEMSPW